MAYNFFHGGLIVTHSYLYIYYTLSEKSVMGTILKCFQLLVYSYYSNSLVPKCSMGGNECMGDEAL